MFLHAADMKWFELTADDRGRLAVLSITNEGEHNRRHNRLAAGAAVVILLLLLLAGCAGQQEPAPVEYRGTNPGTAAPAAVPMPPARPDLPREVQRNVAAGIRASNRF